MRIISKAFDLSRSSVHRILIENFKIESLRLGGGKTADPWAKVATEIMLHWLENLNDSEEYLQRVVTGDETRIYEYDIEMKSQSKEWGTKYI